MKNKALGRPVTTSVAPHATYPDLPTDVIRTGDADWATGAGHLLTFGQQLYRNAFDRSNVGFDTGTDITFLLDLGSAQSGTYVRTSGWYGNSGILRPIQVKLESSDDASAWTSVVDLDSLPGGGAPGVRAWFAELTISAAGSHRYWRLTLQRDPTFLFVSSFEFWG